MTGELKTYCTGGTNPYNNLALEEYLLTGVKDGECILYLWQNKRTVVIGRNQNALVECKTEKLKADGGFLARRLSGGGCVYHDLGNLNFTFIVKEGDYDVDRQLSVISGALVPFGLHAEKMGRNDICIDSKKFSGNAFYKHMGNCYHHGTILVDVDMEHMSEYLHVSAEKLKSNGVSSVRSRVVNLRELNPDINIENMKAALIESFGKVYGGTPVQYCADEPELQKAVAPLVEKYSSNDWLFGRHMKSDYTLRNKFAWGEISMSFKIEGDTIVDVQVFSDSMDETVAGTAEACLKGIRFSRDAVAGAIHGAGDKLSQQVSDDLAQLLKEQEIWNG